MTINSENIVLLTDDYNSYECILWNALPHDII